MSEEIVVSVPIRLEGTAKAVIAEEIKLPTGFSATILGTDLGATRHLTVSRNGDIYAKLSKLKDGKGIFVDVKGIYRNQIQDLTYWSL